jgi:hypothetical protein
MDDDELNRVSLLRDADFRILMLINLSRSDRLGYSSSRRKAAVVRQAAGVLLVVARDKSSKHRNSEFSHITNASFWRV